MKDIQVSQEFRTGVVKAVLAILMFFVVYILLVLLSIAMTVLCGYLGIWLIISFPSIIALLGGIGLISLGILILIFLIKFLFTTREVELDDWVEISKEEQPGLFELVDGLVKESGTDFPGKIYVSSQVGASVFYDSSFWSMFFPIKKNLHIGLGLVNSVTIEELRAILAHEFGHFSQKSMRLGSFVYNVNRVIYNLVFENESYNKLIERWANISGYFSIFVSLAVYIIRGIQWLLKKTYEVVNLSYLNLSREMEFHADAVAVSVTGGSQFRSGLLRVPFAEHAYNSVLQFYDLKVKDGIKSKNLLEEQFFVMDFLGKEIGLDFENHLPQINLDNLNKYNQSKLVIKDQWASHPAIEDRIAAIGKLDSGEKLLISPPANELFSHLGKIQELVTTLIFSSVNYSQKPSDNSLEDFIRDFVEVHEKNSFDKIYNGFYSDRIPVLFDVDSIDYSQSAFAFEELFAEDKLKMVYSAKEIEQNIRFFTAVMNKEIKIKSFDYDGVKYGAKDSRMLKKKLENELTELNNLLAQHDKDIFIFFCHLAQSQGLDSILKDKYKCYFTYDQELDQKLEFISELMKLASFMHQETQVEAIKTNMIELKRMENSRLKPDIEQMLGNELLQQEITPEIRETLEKYISKDWVYFRSPDYFEDYIEMFFDAVRYYQFLLLRTYFLLKKDLLHYQRQLLPSTDIAA
ncbi:MAG: M48 family metalloprotease [Bacteroidia bacterium]